MYAVNTLPTRDMKKSATGCCPPFDPAEWEGQEFIFEQKPFVRFITRSFLHIPLNMSSMMRKMTALIEEAGAESAEHLMLSEDVSVWKSLHYIAVTKNVPNLDMVRLNGRFIAKVFDGPYKNMRIWYKALQDFVKAKDLRPIKTYFNYVFCPNCAKAYGHNYVVGFVQHA